jgi:hypothetical protein
LLGNGYGTFALPMHDNPVADGPTGIVVGDFNGDGRLDLATANDSSGTVSVLLGNGDGTFAPQFTYASGASNLIVAGDFNGDGRLDLVATDGDGGGIGSIGVGVNGYSALSILLGNGDGTFRPLSPPPNEVGTLSLPEAIAVGDFNDDGHLDLAVANEGGDTVSILLGNGDGTFQPQIDVPVGSEPTSIVAGDFNGDGRTDLAVTNFGSGTVSVLLGDGDGTFQPQVTYAVGGTLAPGLGLLDSDPAFIGPYSIVAGDFNGDGHLDLAVANWGIAVEDISTDETIYGGTVSVLLGNGDGTFAPQIIDPVGPPEETIITTPGGETDEPGISWYPNKMVTGDFNGDGRLDLAVTGASDIAFMDNSGMVSVLLGNGDGTFAPPVDDVVGMFPQGIVAGDFNGDGRLDLAVANDNDDVVSVLLGNGDGTFAPQVDYTVGSDPSEPSAPFTIVAGDFNGDGHLDLAVNDSEDSAIAVFLGNGDGTFAPQVIEPVGSNAFALTAGDLNGDGHLDLALTNGEVSVLLGDRDGRFVDPGQLATTPYATPLVADVNGDGTDDVLVVDGAGDILYRQGIAGEPGSFEPPVTVNRGFPSRDIAWVPMTDQGPLLASVDALDDAVSLYAWRDGGFVRIGSLATGLLPAQIIVADLNNNGWDGLVVRNAGDGTLSLFFSSGPGSFAAGVISSGPGGVATGFNPFLPPVTLDVGPGVSDVAAVTNEANGKIYLVVTNQVTGEVSALGDGSGGVIAAPEPYRAGTGLYALDTSGGSAVVTSQEATSGVADGVFTTGGMTDLVTIDPGTETVGVLAGLGNGRFANPVTLYTGAPPLVVRVADFTGNGIDDLAVLTANGVSIYLGDGKGGFFPPVTYDAGSDPTGLTVADLLGNGKLDLLVGNAYGDVLILVGNGDGTFRPFEPVKSAIALAVADLTGNGVPDFVFADQSLNQVTVVYGSTSQNSTGPTVIGDQATGVLAPGAVLLADLIPNQDGQYVIPDLVVANSGGNNVLVYPGLGNGQFGSPINGTAGFPVGTDPTGLTVANLNGQPDLLVADTGSNDVSVLLGQGSESSWTMITGPRVQTDAGPVAVAVGDLLGSGQTDLAVANSGANDVQVFPSVGGGFFNDQTNAVTTIPVGQAPSSLFLGDFNGLGQGLATLNAGSNDGTLISGLGSASPVTQSFPTGGDSPTSGFAGDFTGDGFDDLVVGNNADGRLALLMGGSDGLSLSQTLYSPEAPAPTGLSFAGVSDGLLSFYVSTAGREAAMNLTFDVDAGPGGADGPFLLGATLSGGSSLEGVLSQATSGSVQQVSQLLTISGTTLDLAATLLTVSVLPGTFEGDSGGGAFATLGSTGFGQPAGPVKPDGDSGDPGEEAAPGEVGTPALINRLPAWEGLSIGLERAWEKVRAAVLERESGAPAAGGGNGSAPPASPSSSRPPAPAPTRPGTEAGSDARAKPASSDLRHDNNTVAIDAALEDLDARRPSASAAAEQAAGPPGVPVGEAWTGRVRVLVGLAASTAGAGTVGMPVARWVRRRRAASSGLH